MSFDVRDIRKTMDVYTLDNEYLGTVLRIIAGPSYIQGQARSTEQQTSVVSGELLGPMPTQQLGNQAPLRQSASTDYATTPDATPIGAGSLVVGRWWGLVQQRVIPLADVQTVSFERVVLKQRKSELV